MAKISEFEQEVKPLGQKWCVRIPANVVKQQSLEENDVASCVMTIEFESEPLDDNQHNTASFNFTNKIIKWGNSLAICIEIPCAKKVNLEGLYSSEQTKRILFSLKKIYPSTKQIKGKWSLENSTGYNLELQCPYCHTKIEEHPESSVLEPLLGIPTETEKELGFPLLSMKCPACERNMFITLEPYTLTLDALPKSIQEMISTDLNYTIKR